jgi:hypothetical protein
VLLVLAFVAFALGRFSGKRESGRTPKIPEGPVPPWASSVLAWEQDLAPYIGEICVGEQIEHSFQFTNVGESALQISDVWTDCSCSPATVDNYRVESGQSFSVRVMTTASQHVPDEELMETAARVYFMGHSEPVNVRFRYLVFRPLPVVVDFGEVHPARRAKRVFPVRGCQGFAPTIVSVTAEDPHVSAKPISAKASPAAIPIEVSLDPLGLSGSFVSQVVVRLVDQAGEEEKVAVKVRAEVIPAITVEPPSFSLGVVSPGAQRTARLTLKSAAGLAFEITDVRSILDVQARWAGRNPQNTEYALDILLNVGESAGPVSETIEIMTSHPDSPRVVLPVFGLVSERSL